MTPLIDVSEQAGDWPGVDGLIEPALSALSSVNGPLPERELSIVLSDDDAVQALNRDYRGQNKPTNVLSFPQEAASGLLGDVILSLSTLRREAQAQGKSFEAHFSHLLIHGTLHLLGHDHIEEADAERMEAIEIAALTKLGFDNPYA